MNTFGHNFRITIFGESHGQAIGVAVDGVRSGIGLSENDFTADLLRRKSGTMGTTPRMESDRAQIISGVYNGYTTGAPITVLFSNENIRSADYERFLHHPRPSHADLTAHVKHGGYNDPRGGGHFSGRMTLSLVAAGVIAKKLAPHVTYSTHLTEVGGSSRKGEFDKIIAAAAAEGDSVGGIVECCACGLKAGVGEPFFNSIESLTAHLLFSIPGIKGVEFGRGFGAAKARGSENNDLITNANGATATNNDGGINGGISNGNPIVVRAAVRPASSIPIAQNTYNFESGRPEPLHVEGRHDACIALRAAVVVEAALAIAIADLTGEQSCARR